MDSHEKKALDFTANAEVQGAEVDELDPMMRLTGERQALLMRGMLLIMLVWMLLMPTVVMITPMARLVLTTSSQASLVDGHQPGRLDWYMPRVHGAGGSF